MNMIPKLTEEMRAAIRAASEPVHVEDDNTHERYVLVPEDVYNRVRMLIIDEDFDISDTYAGIDEAFKVIWDKPEMDVYNDYDAHKPQQ